MYLLPRIRYRRELPSFMTIISTMINRAKKKKKKKRRSFQRNFLTVNFLFRILKGIFLTSLVPRIASHDTGIYKSRKKPSVYVTLATARKSSAGFRVENDRTRARRGIGMRNRAANALQNRLAVAQRKLVPTRATVREMPNRTPSPRYPSMFARDNVPFRIATRSCYTVPRATSHGTVRNSFEPYQLRNSFFHEHLEKTRKKKADKDNYAFLFIEALSLASSFLTLVFRKKVYYTADR